MYAPNELSESGFVIPRRRAAGDRDELFKRARWYVRDHHPVVMAMMGGFAIACCAYLVWNSQDSYFSTPAAPLLLIMAMASLGLFWSYLSVLFTPVIGAGEKLLRDFTFVEHARKPLDKRAQAGLEVRGIDLWLALVIQMRACGYR